MISNKEKGNWHYLAVKHLSTLLTSKNNGDFYCLICLHSFRLHNKLNPHENCVKIKIFMELLCQLKIRI